MCALACSTCATRLRSASAPSWSPSRKDSTARRDATSPACAPPIPSATTNNGERTSIESSLARLCRPVSVPHQCSATRSITAPSGSPCARSVDLEGELGVADSDPVSGVQRAGTVEQLLVQVGAVRRAEILDHEDPSLLVDAGVTGRGKRIVQTYLGPIAATEHDVAVEVVDHPGIMTGSALYDQAG